MTNRVEEVKARDYFTKVAYRDLGDGDYQEEFGPMSDEAVLKSLDLSTEKAHDAETLDGAASRVEADAERQNLKVTGAREFVQTVSDRYFAQQAEMTKSYLDRAEQRRAAAAAESNARLEKLEANRGAERSQKQTQAPRASM